MSELENDLEKMERSLRLWFQTVKRPQHWASVTTQTGVNIDRPAAIILHTIMNSPQPGCRVQDLASELGIEAPSVTRKTQELEEAGYIERSRSQTDRRAVALKITAKGKAAHDKLWKAQRQGMYHVLEQWEPAERHKFINLLERFSIDVSDYYKHQ